jgi:hypothetical protein
VPEPARSREILRVTLTPDECDHAIRVGRARHAEHERAGRRDTKVDRRRGERVHIQGALAEQSVAVALALEWDGKFKRLDEWKEWRKHGGDVGGGLEVKATDRTDGSLLLQKHNESTNGFVLVVTPRNTYPAIFLVGWKWGDEIRQQVFWDKDMPRPCWRVSQDCLRSVRSLAKLLPRDRKRTKWVRDYLP